MSMPTTQEGYIPVTGGRVWYRVVGTGPGIPLLVLHGGPGASSGYLEPLTALADDRPVVLYDQLGGGKADHPDNSALWVLERFVQELQQVRVALGFTQLHLFGHSWGTILAIEYALTQPNGLASLILAGPVLSVPRYNADALTLKHKLPIEMQHAIDQHEAAGSTDAPEYQAASVEWWRRHLCRNEAILDSLLQGLDDPVAGINPQVYKIMQGPSEFTLTGNLKGFDRTARLHEIQIPTLFTCGRYDECTPDASAWYHSLLPNSELVIFEHSAHMTHLEEPDAYVQAVRIFLNRAESEQAMSLT